MIIIPPVHYACIQNPIKRDKDGNLVKDRYGQVELRHGEQEIRLAQEPFALLPFVFFFCVCVYSGLWDTPKKSTQTKTSQKQKKNEK